MAGVLAAGVVAATVITLTLTAAGRPASEPGTSGLAAASAPSAAAAQGQDRRRQPGHAAVAAAAPDRSRHRTTGHPQPPGPSRGQTTGHRQASARAREHRTGNYLIYDSVTPGAIPPHHLIATYADGGHPTSPAEVAGRGPVLWIDCLGSDPAASALDVEPGAATPSDVPGWIRGKLSAQPKALAIIYSSISEWPSVQAAVATLPSSMRSRVRWWIADPTGYPHMVPGSDATQWYWGPSYDISTATPRF